MRSSCVQSCCRSSPYDFDAGGVRAARTIARELPEHAPGVPISVEQLTVTPAQLTDWNLPTRPAKKKDPESKTFGKVAVELEAVPPDRLVQLVENAIVQHVDPHAWRVEQIFEREERGRLLTMFGAERDT